MCGIVGYIGKKQAAPILLQGLRDLEYRGYDSAGVALIENGKIVRIRAVGKVEKLAEKLQGNHQNSQIGIAHTRWATHGGVTEQNAHPQVAQEGKLALVHNGIIENYRELKNQIEEKLESETDTEILAKWIAQNYSGDLAEAVKKAIASVRGTYGILVMHSDHPGQLVAARLGSPLAIGIGNGEYYIASDVTPMLPYTKQVTFLDDGEIASINEEGLKIVNLSNQIVDKGVTEIDWNQETAQKGGYEHFMLKEIFDQPTVFEDAIRGRVNMDEGTAHLGGLNMSLEQMREVKRVVIIAEGTARYAGMVGKYAFERLANLPVEVDFSSEFRYRDPIVNKNTLVFSISQSGETADTLMAAREAKRKGAYVRGIVNVIGSTIARETAAGTYIHAGPELAVASTKAYTNMVAILILYALQFGRLKQTSVATGQRLLQALLEIPTQMNIILQENDKIKQIAEKYSKYHNMLFLGRGVNYPVAMEGALKLKEISYIHCEGFAGGELKHGPLALVSKNVPVVAVVTKNQMYEKMKSNVLEAKARGAKILAIASEGDKEIKEIADDVIYVPKTMELLEPLLNTIPLQLFAYHIAVALGRDVDRPRNLAKSVTVE
ncbi:MAG: glutamine--fructose-6-phosphate transaminase (isomerizing) [Candidatus Doudnabacteria bacterium CG10_big_fil_rev_8_21_14_0_10_42_18]|uniref:Glutamine--fructose-6-phosphate aminotransferase [isomerizing] n=1 Tax=Candidatus Doudnabacteria bacterium CG10_big_fil_rev_8_21_14_0_10_42_18 TaxID=1974552 RepID=A0A2H0VCP9_9BACT|nr:MAG: glutamine--fructose-6-phosphate transaminase (isomerizing) [Candidatus Doudnabacteria bacterium CG10_big_fil_rev_8_21_14_0_10_42_18]